MTRKELERTNKQLINILWAIVDMHGGIIEIDKKTLLKMGPKNRLLIQFDYTDTLVVERT